ncbi:hypothetical protein RKD55_000078 [Rossellomorea marisflavi]
MTLYILALHVTGFLMIRLYKLGIRLFLKQIHFENQHGMIENASLHQNPRIITDNDNGKELG